jgi:cytoskeleton protein RodZ
MSDDSQKFEDKAAAEEVAPVCGERLAEGRRTLQITVLEIAKELHLDEPKVRALENNDFDVLGAPVFAKGHMRKYAELVGVDIDDVYSDYYKLTRSSGMPPVVFDRQKINPDFSPGPWIAAIVIILAAAIAYWLIVVSDSNMSSSNGTEEPQQESQVVDREARPAIVFADDPGLDEQVQSAQDLVVETASTVVETPVAEPVSATPDVVEVADTSASASADEGLLSVALVFSGECWTEISDADGRRLFFDMGRDGRSVDLSGKAPLSALFGSADNVSIRVNGSDYTIPAQGRRGNTARFTITNPQI